MSPNRHTPLLTAIASGLLLKAILFAFAYSTAGVTPLDLMAGHDGGEYIAYAHAMCSHNNTQLPVDVVRHDPGLPALLAALYTITANLIPMTWLAFIVQLTSWAGGVYAFARLCNLTGKSPTPLLVAFAVGYPASLYYGQFNLTEHVFTTLILISIWLNQKNNYALAMIIAGLSATIRSTGLLLSLSLLASTFSQTTYPHPTKPAIKLPSDPLKKLIIFAILGVLPWLAGQLLVTYFLGTNVSTHKPTFGLPFSGFRGFSDIGPVRSLYIIGVVGIFIAVGSSPFWKRPLQNKPETLTAPAIFCIAFLLFHLCLKTLYYIDHTVFTLNYYDRYLIPLWPLALLAFRTRINWPTAASMAAVSLFLSLWWLHHYIPASGL